MSHAADRQTARRPAFTLVEVAISIVIIGVMLAAVLNLTGAAATTRAALDDRALAASIAATLLAEILQCDYADPNQPSASLGPEPGETTRAEFDDVDDFDGWSATPPQLRDGTPLTDLAGYGVHVEAAWIDDAFVPQVAESGLKRITVTVKGDRGVIATVEALRGRLAHWRR